MYHEAVGQFDRVARLMGLDDNVADRLRVPQKSTVVSFPFRHDNYTEVETLFGYRVQHLTTMGPTKGGIRFAPDVDLGEVAALAMLDDLEVLDRGPAIRRGQGWGPARPDGAVQGRAAAGDPPFHDGDHQRHRA